MIGWFMKTYLNGPIKALEFLTLERIQKSYHNLKIF